MIAQYSTEIKVAIFQYVSKANVTNKDHCQIAAELRQKIARFNSVNSEIIGRKFTKFVHHDHVAGLLPFNLLKADLRSANPLLNAKEKSKGRFWRCLQTSYKFIWLPQQDPLGDR